MRKAICRFNFSAGTKRELINSSIISAFSIAECFYNKSQMKMSGAGYYLSDDGSWCLIDASNPVGEFVAKVLVGILSNAIGLKNFKVQKIEQGKELREANRDLVKGGLARCANLGVA
jgi:hypothetical protein